MYFSEKTNSETLVIHMRIASMKEVRIPLFQEQALSQINSIVETANPNLHFTPLPIQEYRSAIDLAKKLKPLIEAEKNGLYQKHKNINAVLDAVALEQKLDTTNLNVIMAFNLATDQIFKR